MAILTAQIHMNFPAYRCRQGLVRYLYKTSAIPPGRAADYDKRQSNIQWSGGFLQNFGLTQQSSVCLVRWSYPLRLQRTGPEARASLQTADSSPASPPPRLATCSLNISPLLRGPSCAPSIHRPRLLKRRGDPSAQSSHREPYPVDKLLKFVS